jgi:release factor glutamine methyltransferase
MMGAASVALAALINDAARLIGGAGIAGARAEATALACAVLGLGRERLVAAPDMAIAATDAARLLDAARRRAAHEPFARIVGRREFWSLDFVLSPDTLVPRPETETLVEVVLEAVADRAAEISILDLGTGSGCILLALLSELPNAHGIGIDAAPGAVATAQENARRLGLAARAEFRVGDWGLGVVGPFDVVVSNPPYIAEGDRKTLDIEVREHDPALALFAGDDGLAAYRAIMPQLDGLLAWGGLAAFECGAGQAGKIRQFIDLAGLAETGSRPDLAGHERVVWGRREGFNRALRQVKKTVGKGDIPV